MCRALFIGVDTALKEKLRSKDKLEFVLEKISDEYNGVKHHFTKPNIYYVATSEGCACKFGIDDETFYDDDYEELIADTQEFVDDTHKLIDIILKEVEQSQTIELYCCWMGEYEKSRKTTKILSISENNIRERFQINEREFVVFEP